jgi:predicted nucleic acid-binding protein
MIVNCYQILYYIQSHAGKGKYEEDAMILAAAMLKDIDILVTGDKHFLDNEKLKGFPKVTVRRTVEVLTMLTYQSSR